MRSTRARLAYLGLFATVASTAWAGEVRFQERIPLAAVGSFSLRSEAGRVTVRGGDAAEATITITSERDDFAKLFAVRIEKSQPNRVEVVVEHKSRPPFSWFQASFHSRTLVEVTLPRGVAADVESSGGGIEISNLAGAVRADSSGGGVHAVDLGGSAVLSSSGGSVKAENVAGDLAASSSGGGVHIQEAGGAVAADSSGGSVSVSFAAGNARGGSLDSSGGGVKARVDPSVGLEIDASSSGGSVHCDIPLATRGRIDRDSLRGKLNGGGALLKLRSSGGGVTLAER